MKYFYIVILLLFVSTIDAFPKEPTEEKLLAELSIAKGEDRLKILHQLQQIFLYEPKDNYYNKLLMEEARKQNNAKYQAIALTSQTVYYYRDFTTDSVFYYAAIAEDFDKKNGQYRSLFQVKEILTRRYVEQGLFSQGLKKAMEMKEEAAHLNDPKIHTLALLTLSYVYQILGHYDEAIEYAIEALDVYVENDEAPYNKIQCYMNLINAYRYKDGFDNMRIYLDSLHTQIQFVRENFPMFNLIDFESSYFTNNAYYYIETGQLDKAWMAIEEGDSLMNVRSFPFFVFANDLNKLRYYRAKKDYPKMLEYYRICYDYAKDNQLEGEIRDLLYFKAGTFAMMKHYDEQNLAYTELLAHLDSVNRERFIYELNQIRMEYEVDRKEDEITHQQETINATTKFNLLLVAIVLLLLVSTYIIIRNLRIMKDKNFSLFNQIAELVNTKKELMEFKEKVQTHIPLTPGNKGDTPEDRLFMRIEDFMKAEKPYTQTVYGRKELVIDMNTNEVYLAKAIRKGADLTVHEYINHWRMEYAKQLLLEDMNLTVEAVANDAGFTSIRNFYRLFKDQNGMSPAEFRNYAVDNYKQK